MSEKAISLADQLKDIKSKKDKVKYIKEKYNYYRSCPQGMVDYIKENIKYPTATGYELIKLWDIQEKMIYEIADFLFDMDRRMYIVLGSRQCGKTYTMGAIADYLTTMFNNYDVVLLHADETRGRNNLREFKMLNSNKIPVLSFPPKVNRGEQIIFANDSKYTVIPTQKSSSKSDTGRGLTINLLWIDEGAFVDLEKLEASVFPATSQRFLHCQQNNIPYGIILTSSPNGRVGIGKRFYQLWSSAQENMVDGICSRIGISGFRLHYSMVPGKDEEWVKNERIIYDNRKWNQEFELMFLGSTETFFSDATIKQVQDRISELRNRSVPETKMFISPNNITFEITNFENIKPGQNIILGIDTSRGYSSDFTVIEGFDFDRLEQLFECKNNRASLIDVAFCVDHIVKQMIFAKKGKCILCIEENMGFALISRLIELDPIYATIVYRDTINPDNKSDKDLSPVEYKKCKYGINNSAVTRPFIIDGIYRYVIDNIDKVNSIYLLTEIESLEEKDGKIQGAIHDDACFALGMLLLVKNKGRPHIIRSLLEACTDFWKGGGTGEIGFLADENIGNQMDNPNNFDFDNFNATAASIPTHLKVSASSGINEIMQNQMKILYEINQMKRKLFSYNNSEMIIDSENDDDVDFKDKVLEKTSEKPYGGEKMKSSNNFEEDKKEEKDENEADIWADMLV